jgi:hypothetical protein
LLLKRKLLCSAIFAQDGRLELVSRDAVVLTVDWLVKRATVGTSADTPHSLRMKAKEFRRLAGEERDPAIQLELQRFAAGYEARAAELETAPGAARKGASTGEPLQQWGHVSQSPILLVEDDRTSVNSSPRRCRNRATEL